MQPTQNQNITVKVKVAKLKPKQSIDVLEPRSFKVLPHSQTFFVKHSKCMGSSNIFDGVDGASNIFEKT